MTERLERARTLLFERRSSRERPLLDDKVLTDWNGLMIAALARAGRIAGEPDHVAAAREAADFIDRTMWRDGSLLHRYRAGESALEGNLDLHTFLGLREGNAGYDDITVKVNIDADASPEALQALHDKVSSTSPVGHTLGRAIPIKFELA